MERMQCKQEILHSPINAAAVVPASDDEKVSAGQHSVGRAENRGVIGLGVEKILSSVLDSDKHKTLLVKTGALVVLFPLQ